MKIGLFYSTQGNNNGPGKVVSNLVHGLEMLSLEVLHNKLGDLNGCLQSWGTPIFSLPRETLIGPNLCVLPTEMPSLWSRFSSTIVPCEWVRNKYSSFSEIKESGINIRVWAVGIDTEKFCPSDSIKKWDVLLYVKHKENEVTMILDYLTHLGLNVKVMIYGSYSEEELIRTAQQSKCCVLLTKTESQGIAYQEILSIGVPCYAINKSVWDDIPGYSYPATSVPYFDHRCGVKSQSMTDFCLFYEQLTAYSPRQYVLDELSLTKQARKYVNILRMEILK